MKMMKTLKLTLSGGYHNPADSLNINLGVPAEITTHRSEYKGLFEEWGTASQQKKAANFFCGLKGCICGGARRATFDSRD